MVQKVIYTNS